MAELKTKENDASVDKFIAGIADDQKRKDIEALRKLFEELVGEPAKMWGDSIVGFGNFNYKYASGREGNWMITGFSPRKANITLYIMDMYDNYPDLLAKIGKHKTGKGCLYINKLSDIDEKVLRELVTKSVKNIKSGYFRF